MNTKPKTLEIRDYYTGRILAEDIKNLNGWCEANGYLPHHRTRRGWVVISYRKNT